MKVFISEFYKNLVQETGTSFIFGTTTAAIKGMLNNDSNIIVKQIQALRKGGEYARYTLVYNIFTYFLSRLQIKSQYASMLSLFLTSYLVGRRNGFLFGVKNGLFGLSMSLLSQIYR